VLELLRGVPVRPGGVVGEMVTPTGAALVAGLCQVGTPPPMTPRRVGYGVGTKRWPDRANVLRITIGELVDGTAGDASTVLELSCNLDDCSGQLVARALAQALAAGALDAWAVPCTMKKGRPGLVLSALAPVSRREAVVRAFLSETTTLGVRLRPVERVELERDHAAVETAYGRMRIKVGRLGGEVLSAHPEHDDCLARADERGVPLKEVMAAALAAWRATR
jgi:pyridinium-3,5-bisthiocarboxylic acid mononucleotide nickel chelatase